MTSFHKNNNIGKDKGSQCGPAALYKIKNGHLRPQIYQFFTWSKIIVFCSIRYVLLLAGDRDVGSPYYTLYEVTLFRQHHVANPPWERNFHEVSYSQEIIIQNINMSISDSQHALVQAIQRFSQAVFAHNCQIIYFMTFNEIH